MLKSCLLNTVFYLVTGVLLGYIILIALLDNLWMALTYLPRKVYRWVRANKPKEST